MSEMKEFLVKVILRVSQEALDEYQRGADYYEDGVLGEITDEEEINGLLKLPHMRSVCYVNSMGVTGGVNGFDFDELPSDYRWQAIERLEVATGEFKKRWVNSENRWLISEEEYEIANDAQRLIADYRLLYKALEYYRKSGDVDVAKVALGEFYDVNFEKKKNWKKVGNSVVRAWQYLYGK